MKRLFCFFINILLVLSLQLSGIADDIVCKDDSGHDVYFYESSDYPQYKDKFIAYAKQHICDENLDGNGLQSLGLCYPKEMTPVVDEFVKCIEDSTMSVVQAEMVYSNLFTYRSNTIMARLEVFFDVYSNQPLLERLYRFLVVDNTFVKMQEQRVIKAAKKRWPEVLTPKIDLTDVIIGKTILYQSKIPFFLPYAFSEGIHRTQTELHACKHLPYVIALMIKYKTLHHAAEVKKMILTAFTKEVQEHKKGNYVFWHGRKYVWDYCSYIYKQLYNLTVPLTDKVGDDYTFLRFDDSKSFFADAPYISRLLFNSPSDALYMNAYLFGNRTGGTSSLSLVVKNYDFSSPDLQNTFTAEYMCTQFKLEKYYKKYAEDFKKLKTLHMAANISKLGNLLMIVVDEKNVERVYSAGWQANQTVPIPLSDGTNTSNAKKIIADLSTGTLTKFDHLEYVLPITKDYVLNPKKGPRIYSFNGADSVKYKEFQDFGAQLFAKIASDIVSDKK